MHACRVKMQTLGSCVQPNHQEKSGDNHVYLIQPYYMTICYFSFNGIVSLDDFAA